jgi:hypothetical protein
MHPRTRVTISMALRPKHREVTRVSRRQFRRPTIFRKEIGHALRSSAPPLNSRERNFETVRGLGHRPAFPKAWSLGDINAHLPSLPSGTLSLGLDSSCKSRLDARRTFT